MKRVTFHEDADAELIEAARYYEARTPSLGLALLLDIEDAVSRFRPTQRVPVGRYGSATQVAGRFRTAS